MTSTSASDTAAEHSAALPTMAASSSAVTFFSVARAEWKVYRCPVASDCLRNSSGSSVSMVVLELGTIMPIRDNPAGFPAGLTSRWASGVLTEYLFMSAVRVCR